MKRLFIKILSFTLAAIMLISLAAYGVSSYANENAAPSNNEATKSPQSSTNNTANHLTVFANGEYKVNFVASLLDGAAFSLA